jgi:hypothetical protein
MLPAIIVAVFLVVATPMIASGQYFGKFVGEVEAKWSNDGRQMVLLKPLVYIDPAEGNWIAPKGATVDGASIPKFAWSIIGGPFEGKYRNASVIHDVACDEKRRPWELVHLTFYYAMRASDVNPVLAQIMYAAVYYFGPSWTSTVKARTNIANVDRIRKETMVTNPDSIVDVEVRKLNTCGGFRCEPGQIADMTLQIIPTPKRLEESEFSQLKSLIEQREGQMSLEEIRNFRPSR